MKKRGAKREKRHAKRLLGRIMQKKYLLILGAVIVLVMSLVLVNVGTKVKFLTKDELHIYMEPVQKALYTENGKDVVLNLTLKNENLRPCRSECSLQLYDPYTRTYLFTENISMTSNQQVNREVVFSGNRTGHGQNVYYVEAVCRNVKSLLCKSSESEVYRTGFVTVNHDLSEREKEAKGDLGEEMNLAVKSLNDAAWDMEVLRSEVAAVDQVFVLDEDVGDTELALWEDFFWKLHALWLGEEYLAMESYAGNISEFDSFVKAVEEKQQLYEKGIADYNDAASLMDALILEMDTLNDAYQFYLQSLQYGKVNGVQDTAKRVEAGYIAFSAALFSRSGQHAVNLRMVNESVSKVLEEYNSMKRSVEEKGAFLVNESSVMLQRRADVLNESVSDISGESCKDVKMLYDEFRFINEEAVNLSLAFSSFEGDPEFELMKESYTQYVYGENISIRYDGAGYAVNGTAVNNSLNITPQEYVRLASFNVSSLNAFMSAYCNEVHDSLTRSVNMSVMQLIVPEKPNAARLIEMEFDDVPAKCCIFGSCAQCGVGAGLTPTIFIHGHSFNKENPVESSLSAFSKIQAKMSHEEEFINAGDIDVQSEAGGEYWSEMPYPLTVRASYYYLYYYDLSFYAATVRKTESIENYAIRLKELVDTVKMKTGASKVNIVAHSMGGLVAREYMTLFGTDSVDKLVLVGTPNHGLSGKSADYCPTFGAAKECDEMSEGSVFLKRLNSEENVPKTVKVYTIAGVGCDTDKSEGDGVVKVDNVQLPYATNYNVSGICPSFLGFELHTDMLDPGKYPLVYSTIVSILKE